MDKKQGQLLLVTVSELICLLDDKVFGDDNGTKRRMRCVTERKAQYICLSVIMSSIWRCVRSWAMFWSRSVSTRRSVSFTKSINMRLFYPILGKMHAITVKEAKMMKKAVCIISGGMDSALSSAIAKQDEQIGASALTDRSIEVPIGGLEEGVPVTYVPFRNGIFLSIAASIAEKHGAQALFIGVVEEDSSGYPDCRESYIEAMEKAINLGTKKQTKIVIHMPLVHMKKSQIVQEALKRDVALEHTWSCYKEEDAACGVCDSCRLRLRGFEEAGVEDPIAYAQ